MLKKLSCMLTIWICINIFEAHAAAVLSRFSCTDFGKSTQNCVMKCNHDGSCSESLQIISCNCDGYGEETYNENYFKVGQKLDDLLFRGEIYLIAQHKLFFHTNLRMFISAWKRS